MSETSIDTAESAAWLTVSNEEGRHSIWPTGLSMPQGWSGTGHEGDKDSCLEFISKIWTDSRPAGVGRVQN
ncbi:MbtH family NRPS accessory protein [Streptomyces niveus]|uniref:MbtH family NRPS accessory protein n=1 Tax=Streptomyces niveus TaxID=193462 RepID=UPI00367858E2